MDLLNNSIGRQATIDLINQSNYSEQNLIDALIFKANTGGLWVIVNGVLVVS